MKQLLVSLFAVITLVNPNAIHLTFAPHPDNVGVQFVAQCFESRSLTWQAFITLAVEPDQYEITVPQPTTKGRKGECFVEAHVLRQVGDDLKSYEDAGPIPLP